MFGRPIQHRPETLPPVLIINSEQERRMQKHLLYSGIPIILHLISMRYLFSLCFFSPLPTRKKRQQTNKQTRSEQTNKQTNQRNNKNRPDLDSPGLLLMLQGRFQRKQFCLKIVFFHLVVAAAESLSWELLKGEKYHLPRQTY